MIEALAKSAEIGENAKEVKSSFDPDKRIEKSNSFAERQNEGFDPDRRVEKGEPSVGKAEGFDPDKRVEKSDSFAARQNEGFDPDKGVEKKDTIHDKVDGLQREDAVEKGKPIQNKIDGLQREDEAEKELKEKYPETEGYEIISEAYLRDKDGNIVKDPVTGEARRIDFVVIKDGKAVDSVEVTSKTADKTEQTAKENRIRENGGNYVRDSNGNLVEIPKDVQTRIERKD